MYLALAISGNAMGMMARSYAAAANVTTTTHAGDVTDACVRGELGSV